jgi:hypothetical protein
VRFLRWLFGRNAPARQMGSAQFWIQRDARSRGFEY